jgi:hypothetical protein
VKYNLFSATCGVAGSTMTHREMTWSRGHGKIRVNGSESTTGRNSPRRGYVHAKWSLCLVVRPPKLTLFNCRIWLTRLFIRKQMKIRIIPGVAEYNRLFSWANSLIFSHLPVTSCHIFSHSTRYDATTSVLSIPTLFINAFCRTKRVWTHLVRHSRVMNNT